MTHLTTDKIISTLRYYIENEMWDELQDYYEQIFLSQHEKREYRLNYEYIFQNIYLFVSNKKKEDLMRWMEQIYEGMGVVEKIALKPTLIYGKYLFKNSPYNKN